jgi:hypothetical protein
LIMSRVMVEALLGVPGFLPPVFLPLAIV